MCNFNLKVFITKMSQVIKVLNVCDSYTSSFYLCILLSAIENIYVYRHYYTLMIIKYAFGKGFLMKFKRDSGMPNLLYVCNRQNLFC